MLVIARVLVVSYFATAATSRSGLAQGVKMNTVQAKSAAQRFTVSPEKSIFNGDWTLHGK